MRFVFILLMFFFLTSMVSNVHSQNPNIGSGGLSADDFRDFVNSLPHLPAPIQAVRFFDAPGNKGKSSVAITTFDSQHGWQLFAFEPDTKGRFVLTWKSDSLDDSFAVSDPGALKIFQLANGDAIVFEGCAKHACPDVFSVLLYVPSVRTTFVAKYIWGNVTYTPSLSSPKEDGYKKALQQLIHEHRDE